MLAIYGIGMANLFSATFSLTPGMFLTKQALAFAIGLVVIMIVLYFDYRTLVSNAFYFYVFAVFLVLVVFFVGTVAGGAKRWLSLGGISIQPSELMKPVLLLLLANTLHERFRSGSPLGLKEIWKPIFLTIVPAFIVARQPDLGTACILVLLCLSVLWFVGMKKSTFLVLLIAFVFLSIFAWKYGLQPYQKLRIVGLINSDLDPSGLNYHAKQAMIAVGSGKFFGKGYLHGTQHKLNFIPEHHTDFIFTVIAEEWGFLGSLIVFLLFMSLILRCLKISKDVQEESGSIIAFGCASLIFWQFAINVLMTMRLLPVVGVPLPLMSYGGSNLICTLCLIGLVLNVDMRRYMF